MSTPPSEKPTRSLAAFGIQQGPRAGEEIPVLRREAIIGQGRQADVVIADDSVSTIHARLEAQDGEWRLTDLDSTNGTWVEGVRLAAQVPTPLHFGASVRFGGVRLHFRPGEVEEAEAEAAQAEYAAPAPAERLADRPRGFRFPVWALALVVLLLLLVAALVFGWFTPDPVGVEPVPQAVPTAPAPVEPGAEP